MDKKKPISAHDFAFVLEKAVETTEYMEFKGLATTAPLTSWVGALLSQMIPFPCIL
jgi:hypothetical protein